MRSRNTQPNLDRLREEHELDQRELREVCNDASYSLRTHSTNPQKFSAQDFLDGEEEAMRALLNSDRLFLIATHHAIVSLKADIAKNEARIAELNDEQQKETDESKSLFERVKPGDYLTPITTTVRLKGAREVTSVSQGKVVCEGDDGLEALSFHADDGRSSYASRWESSAVPHHDAHDSLGIMEHYLSRLMLLASRAGHVSLEEKEDMREEVKYALDRMSMEVEALGESLDDMIDKL